MLVLYDKKALWQLQRAFYHRLEMQLCKNRFFIFYGKYALLAQFCFSDSDDAQSQLHQLAGAADAVDDLVRNDGARRNEQSAFGR